MSGVVAATLISGDSFVCNRADLHGEAMVLVATNRGRVDGLKYKAACILTGFCEVDL